MTIVGRTNAVRKRAIMQLRQTRNNKPFAALIALLLTVPMVAEKEASSEPATAPLWGPSGLGIIPTADTVSSGTAEIALGYERVKPNGRTVRYSPTVTASYGLGSRAEVGAAYVGERVSAMGFNMRSDIWAVHGKFRVLDDPRGRHGLAVGVHHLNFDAPGAGHVTSFYATGSKALFSDGDGTMRGHLGLIHHRISNAIGNNSETRPLLGLEWITNDGWKLAADWAPRSGTAAELWSVSLRHGSQKNWGTQIGFGKLQDDSKLFANLIYRFGQRR